MWLIPLLFLIQADCPPCVCEAACEGNAITCTVTTGDTVSMSFDPTPMLREIERLSDQVRHLHLRVTHWEWQYYSLLETTCYAADVYQLRLDEWRWYAKGPGVLLVLGSYVDFDGDGDGDLKDWALAMRATGAPR